jgi:membrane protein YdbS with pleckstrin-like domain
LRALTVADPSASELRSVEPRVVRYWRLSGALTAASSFAGFAVYGIPALFLSRALGIALLASGAVLAIGRLIWALVASSLRYRNLAFSTSGGVLRLRSGVLMRTEKVIPTRRLQHIDIDRGPLERWFDLASVSVFTAGGRRATFRLPGLSPENAERLRAELLRDASEDGGGAS